MAEAYNTLNGLIQFNNKNLADIKVSDILNRAPLLAMIYAKAASAGTQHQYLKQTVDSIGSFRAALAGATGTASSDELITITLKILDGSFDTDVALADAYNGGRDAWLQMELVRKVQGLMFQLEKQCVYGTKTRTGGTALASAAGFTGLANSADLDAVADDMVIAAITAGSSADSQTSVWMIRTADDGVSVVLGNDGNFVVEDNPTIIQKVVNPGTDNTMYPALFVPVTGYSGLQLGSKYDAARICNIESALTDDDIYAGLSLFKAGMPPNVIAMSRKAMKLLRQSRTAVNVTGAAAPFVTEIEGIPVVVTDAISDTEPVIG
jgi:hypothetical protein